MPKKPHFREIQFTLSGDQRELLLFAVESLDEQFEDDDFRDQGFSSTWARKNLSGIRDRLLPGIWIELTRAVEDDDGEFDETRDHEFSKREIYAAIAQELEWAWEGGYLEKGAMPGSKPRKISKKSIPKLARKFTWPDPPKFLEFDSGRSHASGYWELRIQGPAELEEALENYQEAP